MKDMAERFTYGNAISIVPHWECQTSTGVGALGMDGIGSSARHAWRPISPSLNFVTFSFAEMLCIRRSQSSISFKNKVNEYRMYDPVMSSFLSVDNYVQSPENSQNFNRYAYCLNNPLKYTDPSGKLCFAAVVAIGAAVSVACQMTSNAIHEQAIFKGVGRAAITGALQGAFSYGIGQVAEVIGAVAGEICKASFQVVAHGTLGGCSTYARGGEFGVGFASGAVSSAISSVTVGICEVAKVSDFWTRTATVAAGGLSGGVTSTMAGGDFWDGVCNGLICAGLNHAMHLVIEGGSPDDPPEENEQEETHNGRLEKEAAAVGGGMATMVGGAAGQTVKTLKLDPKLSRFAKVSKWSNRIGLGGVALNFRNNIKQASKGNISYTSALIRTIVSGGEFVISKIPEGGPIISIVITSYDIGGGFDNNIYNVSDDWFYNLFNMDKPSTSQSHGYTGSW